jgi:serine/threonine protein kinase
VLNEKWTLDRLLGVGGMAAVYAARHRNGARAALKVLHLELSRNKQIRERFLREGYAANRVENEGVVKVLDDDVVSSGEEAGTAYLVMELLEGQSLQTRMDQGPNVGEREFLAIADSVLEVLEAAHARGVVHRDLKPENLFLLRSETGELGADRKPRVKVLDFGLARIADGQSNTAYGLALGTPSFMSPEQAAGKTDEIDGRTDLFALATTGFRVRTGRKLHDASNAVELVMKMASLAAPPIASVCPEVSPGFARIIDRALQFKRQDRYEDATAMRQDVQRVVSELDGLARTVLSLEAPPPSSSGPVPPPSRESAKPPLPVLPGRRARHRRSAVPWVLAVMCAGAGVALWLQHSRTDGASTATSPVARPSAALAASTAPQDPPPPATSVPDASSEPTASSAAVRPTSSPPSATVRRPAPSHAASPPGAHSSSSTRRKPH